jgi:hypothetical protein
MTPPQSDIERRLGAIATLAFGAVLMAWALTVDFAKATGNGFFSDGSTYYSLAYSLAEDGDFAFAREDLVRVWREYPSGPEGIFLKRGRDVHGVSVSASLPFIHIATSPDPDTTRLYYAKSFIFPLAAAPFVRVFGTNGFLVLHALLMTACFWCAYTFLVARSSPLAALVFAAAFLFASVAPVYMAWLTPDFFNLTLVLIAYFFWCFKEVAPEPVTARGRWTAGVRSDLIAAVLLGVATFSKPTHAMLMGPLLALLVLRRQWLRSLLIGGAFAVVAVGLFLMNLAIAGEANYQGGEDRSTFYSFDPDGQGPRLGGFPFQTEGHTFEATGMARETNRVPVEVLTSRDAVLTVFRHNLWYFVSGRHTGFVPYFFPGALALVLFLARPRQRPLWQWLTLVGGVGSAMVLILYMPFTYSGGGGPVGNRYFLGHYPLFLFLAPALSRPTAGLVALAGGALFTAQLVFNPFYVSLRPGEHTQRGLFRAFPVELTLLNDLPVNLSPSRSKQALGGDPPLTAYFLDDRAYNRERWDPQSPSLDAFWVRGESRTEVMLRAPVAREDGPGGAVDRSLRLSRLTVELQTGAVPNRVIVSTGVATQVVEIPAHDRRAIEIAMDDGIPYKAFPELPTNYVYLVSIASETGFIPMFEEGGRDSRFLGVFVRLVPIYE